MIGLLALTAGPGDKAHEILEESVKPISVALKSRSDNSKISSVCSMLVKNSFNLVLASSKADCCFFLCGLVTGVFGHYHLCWWQRT